MSRGFVSGSDGVFEVVGEVVGGEGEGFGEYFLGGVGNYKVLVLY